MTRFPMTALAFTLVLVAAIGAGEAWRPDPSVPAGPRGGQADMELAAATLRAFDDCGDLLDTVKAEAAPLVSAWGINQNGDFSVVRSDAVALEAADGASGGAVSFSRGAGSSGSAGGSSGEDQAAAPAEQAQTSFDDSGVIEVSGTNVQERGVDEPDVIKSDGRIIAAIARGRLQLLDITGGTARLVHDMELPGGWNQELLLHGDRLLITSNVDEHSGGAPNPAAATDDIGIDPARSSFMIIAPSQPKVQLTLLDVSDPAAPRTVGSVRLDGQVVSSRLVDGMARVVMRSQNQPSFTLPQMYEDTTQAQMREREREGLRRNQEILRDSTAEDWLPGYTVLDASDGVVEQAPMVDCAQVRYPAEFQGFGMVSVLALDLDADAADALTPTGVASVMGEGDTVYATPDRLFVAINRWQVNSPRPLPEPQPLEDPANDVATSEIAVEPDIAIAPAPGIPVEPHGIVEIHMFDTSDPAQPRYAASGAVPGSLLNQWALSSHNDHLRVATTRNDTGGSVSAVHVLNADGPALVETGRADRLGRTERIYAVRYFGDVGYVVTFRQTDPLYTLDLSDPANPRVLGELKIPGFSSYLHPVGDGLLMGIGQDADETTGQRKGMQVSLFDVSDLSSPQRVASLNFEPHSMTDVEHDHRAFLWWPALRRAILPYQAPQWDPASNRETGFFGAVAVDVADGLRQAGRVSHSQQGKDPWFGQIRRALVAGDTLYTMSELGLMANSVSSLAQRGWTEFNGPQPSDVHILEEEAIAE